MLPEGAALAADEMLLVVIHKRVRLLSWVGGLESLRTARGLAGHWAAGQAQRPGLPTLRRTGSRHQAWRAPSSARACTRRQARPRPRRRQASQRRRPRQQQHWRQQQHRLHRRCRQFRRRPLPRQRLQRRLRRHPQLLPRNRRQQQRPRSTSPWTLTGLAWQRPSRLSHPWQARSQRLRLHVPRPRPCLRQRQRRRRHPGSRLGGLPLRRRRRLSCRTSRPCWACCSPAPSRRRLRHPAASSPSSRSHSPCSALLHPPCSSRQQPVGRLPRPLGRGSASARAGGATATTGRGLSPGRWRRRRSRHHLPRQRRQRSRR